MTRLLFWLPTFVLIVLCALLGVGLSQHPHKVPSRMVGQKLPAMKLPMLNYDHLYLKTQLLPHQVILLNIWASWCAGCSHEHSVLTYIAAHESVPLYGIAYKDDKRQAKQWLQKHGNPFDKVALDQSGQMSVRLGIAGTPETYVLDQHHVVRYIHRGPLTFQLWRHEIKPLIKKINQEAK